MPNTELKKHLHVAVGVISNDKEQILISRRHENQDQGGLWEFPGGKLKPGETVEQALVREFKEELGIRIESSRPLIKIKYDYPEYSVLLDVWKINEFSGKPSGREGQEICWLEKHRLRTRKFPQANYFISSAINLPSIYFITPDPADFNSEDEFISKLERPLIGGCKLVQFRTKKESPEKYIKLISRISSLCKIHNACLLVNGIKGILSKMDVDGIHLSSKNLMKENRRPVKKEKLLAVSCHNKVELERAKVIDADFIVLGPVAETNSHPGTKGMGWDAFTALVETINIPVYALGGMNLEDLQRSRECGAQGLAMLSGLWDKLAEEHNVQIEE